MEQPEPLRCGLSELIFPQVTVVPRSSERSPCASRASREPL